MILVVSVDAESFLQRLIEVRYRQSVIAVGETAVKHDMDLIGFPRMMTWKRGRYQALPFAVVNWSTGTRDAWPLSSVFFMKAK